MVQIRVIYYIVVLKPDIILSTTDFRGTVLGAMIFSEECGLVVDQHECNGLRVDDKRPGRVETFFEWLLDVR